MQLILCKDNANERKESLLSISRVQLILCKDNASYPQHKINACEKTFTLKKTGQKHIQIKLPPAFWTDLISNIRTIRKQRETPKAVHPQICWMNILASSKHILLIYKHTLFQARLSHILNWFRTSRMQQRCCMRMFPFCPESSSGWQQIKFGICESLTWTRRCAAVVIRMS